MNLISEKCNLYVLRPNNRNLSILSILFCSSEENIVVYYSNTKKLVWRNWLECYYEIVY